MGFVQKLRGILSRGMRVERVRRLKGVGEVRVGLVRRLRAVGGMRVERARRLKGVGRVRLSLIHI